MTEDTGQPVSVVSRREALAGTGVALGSLVASGTLTETVLAQSGGPSDEISGTVEDDSGAVDGATVVAVPHDTSLAALETTTDASGDYIFEQADLHEDSNLYHVIARDGTESNPRRGEQNYPFVAAEGPAAIPDSGLSRWTWDDTPEDNWGNKDATVNGASYTTTAEVGSHALSFDGVDDNADLGTDIYTTEIESGSFAFWVYPRNVTATNNQDIVSFEGLVDATIMEDSGTNANQLRCRVYDGGNQYAYGSQFSNNTWHHICWAWDGSNAYLYENGSQVASIAAGTPQFSSFSRAWRVGADYDGSNEFFDGIVDDLRLYNKALTETEANNLYNTGSISG